MPLLSASPSEGHQTPPGNSHVSPPTNVVSDSFFEAVDNLILTHKKSSIPPSSSNTILGSPPQSPLSATIPPLSSDSYPNHAAFPWESKDPPFLSSTVNSQSLTLEPRLPGSDLPVLDSMENFPPLLPIVPLSGQASPPHSPISSPSFSDPSLKRSLSIFTASTPTSPSTLHLNSIRFANVTVRKRPKGKRDTKVDISSTSPPYIPLSVRIKDAARGNLYRGVRAMSPPKDMS